MDQITSQDQARQLIGQDVHTTTGDSIGTITEVYLDEDAGQPEWVIVGRFGAGRLVPLMQARPYGGGLVVPYTRQQIRDAPRIGDPGQLTEAQEHALYAHYELGYPDDDQTSGDDAGDRPRLRRWVDGPAE